MVERQMQPGGTRCERQRSPGPGVRTSPPQQAACSEVPLSYEATEIVTPSGLLNALEPDEQRLVVLCCSLDSKEAPELLQFAEPGRAEKLAEAARALATMERRERIALFARLLSPPVSREVAQAALDALRSVPPWLAALACRSLPAEVREPLLYSPEVRQAWESPGAPHPALESLARRLAARLVGG